MGYVERYLRNRMKLQIVTNYVGVIGALFFSLQNLSTNWGGSYQDDSALEDAVKVRVARATCTTLHTNRRHTRPPYLRRAPLPRVPCLLR